MRRVVSFQKHRRANRPSSFTLVELLVVMAIIAILAALTLSAASAVMNKAARSRASSEISAMSTALESYKTDNGIYPPGNTLGNAASILIITTGSYPIVPTAAGYQTASAALFQALSGVTNYATDTLNSGTKAYMTFKANQIGNLAGPSYINDPWNYAYGYSTGSVVGSTTNAPYNGYGFFDLWSTGGTLGAVTSNTNTWISNWQ